MKLATFIIMTEEDSSSVEKDDGNLYFYDSFITPCEIDGYFECPTWSIRVDKQNII